MMWVASPDNFFLFSSFSSGASTVLKKEKKRGGERGKQWGKLIKITYTLFTERKTLVSTGTTHPSGSYKMTAAECTNILSFTKTVHRLPCNKVCLSPLFRFFFFFPPSARDHDYLCTERYWLRRLLTQCGKCVCCARRVNITSYEPSSTRKEGKKKGKSAQFAEWLEM